MEFNGILRGMKKMGKEEIKFKRIYEIRRGEENEQGKEIEFRHKEIHLPSQLDP